MNTYILIKRRWFFVAIAAIMIGCQQPLDVPQKEDKPIVVSSITLDASHMELIVGEERVIHVTFSPTGAEPLPLEWESSNSSVATVNDGKIKALYPGKTNIVAKIAEPYLEVVCVVEVKPDMTPVDLGLGALWAPMNLGASSPSDEGYYFAWGEISPKTEYSQATYRYWDGNGQTKYYHDRKYVLDKEDDAARAIWGDGWRLPTEEEVQQLIDLCEWTAETMNGIEGARVVGPNGNSVYFPFSGAMVEAEKIIRNSAWYRCAEQTELCFSLEESTHKINPKISANSICIGFPIRPVKSITLNNATFETTSIVVNIDTKITIPLKTTPSLGTAACLNWINEREDVALVCNGEVLGLNVGQTKVVASSPDGAIQLECLVTVQDWTYPEAESVDLGLSVEWASWNLGASTPEESGDYFSWGETTHKALYVENNYHFYDENKQLKKYSVENPILDEEDDVATAKWSNGWRMPTEKEIEELIDYCTWTWITQNGVDGMVASRNGKSLFFPASSNKSGYHVIKNRPNQSSTNYASASLDQYGLLETLHIGKNKCGAYASRGGTNAFCWGFQIRPVRFPVSHDLSLNLKKVRIEKGETLDALKPEKSKGAASLCWSSSNEDVVACDNGKLSAKSDGTAIITATAERGGASASCEVVIGDWTYPVADAIDLGLSVKWASWNIGATSIGDYGDYIFWGTLGHGDKYLDYYDYRAHIEDAYYGENKQLEKADDVAYAKWGEGWRLPTKADYEELIEKCAREFTCVENNPGVLFTGPNGNSVFFPAAPGRANCGYGMEHIYKMGLSHNGMYWTGEMSDSGYPYLFWFLQNWTEGVDDLNFVELYNTFSYTMGLNVRAVYEK